MKKIEIIGVPLDLGAGRRGVDVGPSAIRLAGIHERMKKLGYQVLDQGDLHIDVPETLVIENARLKYLPEIETVLTNLAARVDSSLTEGNFPLILGGDHSIAIGTFSGVAGHFKKKNKKIGLIWIDAHGDMNTHETTPSGNIHGMSFAALLGKGARELTCIHGDYQKIAPENAVLIGAHCLDLEEQKRILDSGITVFTMEEIDRRGMYDVMVEAMDIAFQGTDGAHLSFDMDAIDPDFAPGVGTPVPGGLTYREAHLTMEMLAKSGKLTSIEIVETNPVLDVRNQTAELSVELILSALGKRIL